MRILLTNDDGIDAPGIASLERAVGRFGEFAVVAPHEEQSGCSHRTTTDRPLRLEPRGGNRFALDGAPADCVRVALHQLGEFDLVVAGINSGGNLGVDVYHSGTVAAVREAAMHGVRGAAFSHYRNRALGSADWLRAEGWTTTLLGELLGEEWPVGVFWNVNFPCLADAGMAAETVRCPLDYSPLPLEFTRGADGFRYSGSYQSRRRQPGGDVDVCFGGRIAMTPLKLGH
jgi:5'-nucleotidase